MPNSVELPKRLPLALSPDNRGSSTTQDARLVNGFMERDSITGDYKLFKRPGLLLYSQPSGGAAAGNGIYTWKGNVYSVFGGNLYKDTTLLHAVDSTGGVYAFSETSGTTPRLVLGNGAKAYTYDGTTFAQITSVNFPATFFKGWSYLDKTTYVMSTPNNIWGSGLDDPTTWDALNLINAQVRPDLGIGLSNQLVYVVAFKQRSTEVFYDAANATASPLSTVQGAKVNWGCLNIDTVRSIDDVLFWVGNNEDSAPQVLMVENLKPAVISTPPIERLIKNLDYTKVNSFTVKVQGHWFYGVTFSNASDNLTLVYDVKEQMWAQWTDTSGNFFPIVSSTKGSSGQVTLFQHATNGNIYKVDPSYVNDDGSLFTVDAYLPNFDAGTERIKMLSAMYFSADQVTGSVLQVRKSDDDFQTWSNFRYVDLSKKKPMLDGCGSFVRRAYHLRHRCNTSFRLHGIDLQMDLGTL